MRNIDFAYLLSGRSRDPFDVPLRHGETIAFLAAAGLGALFVAAALIVPWEGLNGALLIGLGAIALLCLISGIRQRRHRLIRVRDVGKLRATLSRDELDA